MANLTVQRVQLNGIDPVFNSADVAGDSFVNDGRVVLHVKNSDVSDKTVTVDSVAPCNQGSFHDLLVTIPAGDERLIGPFSVQRFNDSNNKVNITYSAVTSVTVAVIKN